MDLFAAESFANSIGSNDNVRLRFLILLLAASDVVSTWTSRMAQLTAPALINSIAAAFFQWGRLTARHHKLHRFSFICLGVLISLLLMEIAVGSMFVPKAFDPAVGAAALLACAWVLLLVVFAIRRAAAVWPIALLQMSVVLVIAGPAIVLLDHVALRCFYIVLTAFVLANGLAKLAAGRNRFRDCYAGK